MASKVATAAAVATTWVMSAACAHHGCTKIPLFSGFVIPFSPMKIVIIDQEYVRVNKRGAENEGGLKGFLGYSFVQIAGHFCLGCPIAVAVIDTGPEVLGEVDNGASKFNHSGAVSFGFWDDNYPDYYLGPGGDTKDPALDLVTFMYCGNELYPISGTDMPDPKPGDLWGVPHYEPTALVWRFSFYFGDKGGCLFMDPGDNVGGTEMYMAGGGIKWIMVMPLSVKFKMPSWLFILNDVKVRGKSIEPCVFGICKGTVHTGRFPIVGPGTPIQRILESCTADYMCLNLHELPDITFTIMGIDFIIGWEEYAIMYNKYGNKHCLTGIVDYEVEVFTDFTMWIFGDVWVRAFYSIFERIPLRRIGFARTDHKYYEQNGCVCGDGKGPIEDWLVPGIVGADNLAEKAAINMANVLQSAAAAIGNEDGNNGGGGNTANNMAEKAHIGAMENINRAQQTMKNLGPLASFKELRFKVKDDPSCKSGMRFIDGKCVNKKALADINNMKKQAEKQHFASSLKTEKNTNFSSGNLRKQFFKFNSEDKRIRMDPNIKVLPEEVSGTSMIEEGEENGQRKLTSTMPRNNDRSQKQRRMHHGPYVAWNNKCPASKDLNTQEKHFYSQSSFVRKLKSVQEKKGNQKHGKTKDGVPSSSYIEVEEETEEQIYLPKNAITDDGEMGQMLYNISKLYHRWAKKEGISKKSMSRYWHGETEDFIYRKRIEMTKAWENSLKKIKKILKSHKYKVFLNKKIIERFAQKMKNSYWKEKIIEIEEARENGDEINVEDHQWGSQKSDYEAEKMRFKSRAYRLNRKRFANSTWKAKRLRQTMKDYPGLWNLTDAGVINHLNETVIHKLHHKEGAWYNLSKHEKFLNLYHSMANETKKKHAATWKQLDKFTKILHKHKSGLHDKLHSEIVSHEVRKLYDYFNSTSGRVILGVGTEISDEEDGQ